MRRTRSAPHAQRGVPTMSFEEVRRHFCQGFDLLDDHAGGRATDGDLLGSEAGGGEVAGGCPESVGRGEGTQDHGLFATKMNPALKAAQGG